jgi:hypothetical protein
MLIYDTYNGKIKFVGKLNAVYIYIVEKKLLVVGIKSFIRPTNAQLNCFKILKFTLKFTINAPTCFSLTKPLSGSLQSVLRQSYNIATLAKHRL